MADPEGTCLGIALGILDRHGIDNEKLAEEIADAMVEQWKRGWNQASESFAIRKKKKECGE